MATSSGLQLLLPEEFDFEVTTSYGTGELIKAAFLSGAKHLIIGIGGSAPNDCGFGMTAVLGFEFFRRSEIGSETR